MLLDHVGAFGQEPMIQQLLTHGVSLLLCRTLESTMSVLLAFITFPSERHVIAPRLHVVQLHQVWGPAAMLGNPCHGCLGCCSREHWIAKAS